MNMDKRMGRGEQGADNSRAINCFTCQSRNKTEWCHLHGDDLRVLNQVKVCNIYKPGQIIFYQGNPCLGLYCIERGTVAIRKSDAAGNSVLVRLAHDGSTIGYRAYFGGGTYSGTAEALSECRICFIDRSAVRTMMDHNPAVGLSFLQHMATDLQDSEELRLQSSALPVRARVAHLLLVLKDKFGTAMDDGSLSIELPLSRQDIAAMIGTRPETISRVLKAMEEDEVAIFTGRTVEVADLDLLLDEIDNQ